MKRRWFACCMAALLMLACQAMGETLNIRLDAPLFLQKDGRWRDALLNEENTAHPETIGEAGCALCVLASAESLRSGETINPLDMAEQVAFKGNSLSWPKGYETLMKAESEKQGFWVRQAAPLLTALLESGRPALVCMMSETLGSHWVLVYGCENLSREDPQTAQYLIRDPGTKDRVTLNMTKEWFPNIYLIKTYDATDELRMLAAACAAIP